MNPDFRPDIAPARTDAPFRLQSAIIDLLLSGAESQVVLDEVCRLVEAEVADAVCSFMTLDDEGRALWVKSAPSLPAEAREAVDGLLPGEFAGSCGTAVFTGEPAIVNDTMIDDRWADMRDFAQRFGVLAAWSVPIYAAGDRPVGSFAVSRFVPGAPTAQDRALMSTAGHIIDLIVMRAREERETSDRDQLIRALVENADEADRPCSGPGRRVSRSFLSASIRPARSLSAIRPRACNLRALAGRARCGTSTAPLNNRASSCASLPKPLTGCAISALRAMCRKPAGALARRCGATPLRWDAR